jgi:hypothetical protein
MAEWIVYKTGEMYSARPRKSVSYTTLLFSTQQDAALFARANGATDVQYQ